jgi:hypothetical protein
VIDGLVEVLLHLVQRVGVDGRFIGQNNFDVPANVGVDNLSNGCGLCILGANHAQIGGWPRRGPWVPHPFAFFAKGAVFDFLSVEIF